MKEETTHYRKVLISEEGLPESYDMYMTDLGWIHFDQGDVAAGEDNEIWQTRDPYDDVWSECKPQWWLKPYSPKEEAVRFAEWCVSRYFSIDATWIPKGDQYAKDYRIYLTSELYDKFKQESK